MTRNKKTSISRHSRVSAVVTERQRSLGVEPSVNSNLSRASTFAFANRAQDPLPTSQRISRSRISANKFHHQAFPPNQGLRFPIQRGWQQAQPIRLFLRPFTRTTENSTDAGSWEGFLSNDVTARDTTRTLVRQTRDFIRLDARQIACARSPFPSFRSVKGRRRRSSFRRRLTNLFKSGGGDGRVKVCCLDRFGNKNGEK